MSQESGGIVLPVGKIKGEENMKVYPDNNVLVDIEAGKYSAEMFLSISDVVYYYSDAHMNELLEAKGNPKVSQEGRLGLISKLCGCNNILTGVCDVPEIYEKEPLEMYRICNIPLRAYIAQQVNTGDELFAELRDRLGFDSTLILNSKIFVAGHHGLVGSAIWNNLKARGYNNLIDKSHKELDLTNQAVLNSLMKNSLMLSCWRQPSLAVSWRIRSIALTSSCRI